MGVICGVECMLEGAGGRGVCVWSVALFVGLMMGGRCFDGG